MLQQEMIGRQVNTNTGVITVFAATGVCCIHLCRNCGVCLSVVEMASSVGDLLHSSHGAVAATSPAQLGVPSQPSSANSLSALSWR